MPAPATRPRGPITPLMPTTKAAPAVHHLAGPNWGNQAAPACRPARPATDAATAARPQVDKKAAAATATNHSAPNVTFGPSV